MSKCWYLLRLGMPSVPKRLFPGSLECLLRFANHGSSTLFLFVFARNQICCNQRREFQFIWNDFTLLYFTTWWKVNSNEKLKLTISPLGEIQTFTRNAGKIFTITPWVTNIMYDYYYTIFGFPFRVKMWTFSKYAQKSINMAINRVQQYWRP